MEKTIVVDGREIRIKACASTAIRYQQVYGEHIDGAMVKAVGGGDMLEGGVYEAAAKLLYIMAWHCDHSLVLDREAAMEWLDRLGTLDASALEAVVSLFFRK